MEEARREDETALQSYLSQRNVGTDEDASLSSRLEKVGLGAVLRFVYAVVDNLEVVHDSTGLDTGFRFVLFLALV